MGVTWVLGTVATNKEKRGSNKHHGLALAKLLREEKREPTSRIVKKGSPR